MRHAIVRMGLGAWLALAATVLVAGSAWSGPYTRLQVLLPGETAAPGTASGKTGTPTAQVVGVPFSVTVRACDDTWTTVTTVTDAFQMSSTDGSAMLPGPLQLVDGERTFSITFQAQGTFTVSADDQTDGTIPTGTSSSVISLLVHGFEFSRINQKNQYAGQPQTITLTAVDPAGNLVSGFSGQVQLSEITSYGPGRVSPQTVNLSGGTWTGAVTCYRADETSINRGNVNLFAELASDPSKNGTSDPFTVHPGTFSRLQIVVPGEDPLPGSLSGLSGSPANQGAGQTFAVNVYATDSWWNPVPSADQVRIISSDANASTPVTGTLSNGAQQFTLSLGTTGTQTLTVSDMTNGSIASMTSAGILVLANSAQAFAIDPITGPLTAGQPVSVHVRATDSQGNTVTSFTGQALLTANTGAGSITPTLITFTNGDWTGPVTFFGAGGSVSLTCSDFSAPPHTGSSNAFVVQPGPLAGLQVLLPGETALGGTPTGKSGIPTDQSAGSVFTLTVRAVDAYWNLVSGVNDTISLGSTDAFAGIPADTTLVNGQVLIPSRLYRTGYQYIWASDVNAPSLHADTSSAVRVVGGPFSRLLVLAPGESPAPGTVTGRTGAATDQSINYAFDVTVLATDSWWNPVTGVTDVVHLTSSDPLAQLAPDQALVDGSTQMSVRLATGGYQLINVNDVTQPTIQGSSTQVRAISSGFHLEATVTPDTARAGDPFTLTVRVTNDAGSVIQEVNSFVTVQVLRASDNTPGNGTLLTTQFQLLQGQRSVSETYTYAEPIVIVAHDDLGNAPATSNTIQIIPGVPAAVALTSNPSWVGGNKHAQIRARVTDAYDNGVSGQPVTFSLVSGTGTLTPVDSLTDATGLATADFLSPRQPETDRIHAASGGLSADLDLQTAFVDPNAAGGTITSYPNPFHPPSEPATIAYKLADDATVTLRIFTLTGNLVLREQFQRGAVGGRAGLNTFVWDGRNGRGDVVASGGYIALLEAQGVGETLHVMRRRIAVVR